VNEPAFVEQWIQAVRGSSDPRLRDVGILVRPHPSRLDEWRQVDLSGYRDVAFWGAHPVDDTAKEDYFDSMFYSAAVVGINTSAFIEAAVVGKPVHTVLLPEISTHNQEGTLHFHYLLEINGGLLRVARSFEEHVPLLAGSLSGHGGGDEKAARFVDGFVRPFGRGTAATPRFVDAVESAVSLPAPRPQQRGISSRLAFLALVPMAAGSVASPAHATVAQASETPSAEEVRAAQARRAAIGEQFVSDQFVASGKRRKAGPPPASPRSHRRPAGNAIRQRCWPAPNPGKPTRRAS
jgi:hypothetical protein